MKFIYCPLCGRKLVEKYSWDEGGVPYCENDKIMFFDTPKPCVVVAVVKNDEILLLKQSYIFKNSKVLVSGYVTNGETVEESVKREVREEIGLEIKDIKYLGSHYVKEKELIMLTFMAKHESGEITKSSEVEFAEWFKIDKALSQMKEDIVGTKTVDKVIEEINSINK